MSEKKTPDQLLIYAIGVDNLEAVRQAIAAGADVINGIANPDSYSRGVPLFHAVMEHPNTQMMELLIDAVIEQSKVYVDGVLDAAQTEQAIARNLLDRTRGDSPQHLTLDAESAMRVAGRGMLATVWPHFRGKRDINRPLAGGMRVIHRAAPSPDNLTYALKEGGDINIKDDKGMTPLMHAIDNKASAGALKRLFAIYDKHKADFHATDIKGETIIFYALGVYQGKLEPAQIRWLDYALSKGVPPFAADRKGKTAIDYLLEHSDLESSTLMSVCETLAAHGYSVPALIQKYYPHPVVQIIIPEIEQAKRMPLNFMAIGATEELWNPDGSPSGLLLRACGYEILPELFNHPSLKDNPTAALALYKRMQATLPPQCQDFLRNGFDKTFLRDVAQPPKSPAVLSALRRNKPDGEKGLGR